MLPSLSYLIILCLPWEGGNIDTQSFITISYYSLANKLWVLLYWIILSYPLGSLVFTWETEESWLHHRPPSILYLPLEVPKIIYYKRSLSFTTFRVCPSALVLCTKADKPNDQVSSQELHLIINITDWGINGQSDEQCDI